MNFLWITGRGFELGRDWELLTEDGEIVGSKYQTRAVGEIDLVAKHSREKRWLVAELKRNQSSDANSRRAIEAVVAALA